MSSESGVGALTTRPTCGIHGLVNGLIRNEVVLFSCWVACRILIMWPESAPFLFA